MKFNSLALLIVFCSISLKVHTQYSAGGKIGLIYSTLNQVSPHYFTWECQPELGYTTEIFYNWIIIERFSSNFNLGYENLNTEMSGAFGSKFESYREEGKVRIHSLMFDIQPRIVILKRINLELITGISVKQTVYAKFNGYRDGELVNDDIRSVTAANGIHYHFGLGSKIKLRENIWLVLDVIAFNSISEIGYHAEDFKALGTKLNLGLSFSLN